MLTFSVQIREFISRIYYKFNEANLKESEKDTYTKSFLKFRAAILWRKSIKAYWEFGVKHERYLPPVLNLCKCSFAPTPSTSNSKNSKKTSKNHTMFSSCLLIKTPFFATIQFLNSNHNTIFFALVQD